MKKKTKTICKLLSMHTRLFLFPIHHLIVKQSHLQVVISRPFYTALNMASSGSSATGSPRSLSKEKGIFQDFYLVTILPKLKKARLKQFLISFSPYVPVLGAINSL